MPTTIEDRTEAEPALRKCRHCGSEMERWFTPPESSWEGIYQYVCFNDECSYYARGWEWMQSHFSRKASYRHRYNPFTGDSGPLPVWSPMALRNGIIPEGMSAETFAELRARPRDTAETKETA
jgi:hypothetical protein